MKLLLLIGILFSLTGCDYQGSSRSYIISHEEEPVEQIDNANQ